MIKRELAKDPAMANENWDRCGGGAGGAVMRLGYLPRGPAAGLLV